MIREPNLYVSRCKVQWRYVLFEASKQHLIYYYFIGFMNGTSYHLLHATILFCALFYKIILAPFSSLLTPQK